MPVLPHFSQRTNLNFMELTYIDTSIFLTEPTVKGINTLWELSPFSLSGSFCTFSARL